MVTAAAPTMRDLLAVVGDTDARILLGVVTGLPAIIAAFGAYNSRKTRKELKPNGGASAMDKLNRIDGAVKDLSSRMSAVEDYITNPKENQ